ncbi:MAG: HNH endonuclease [Lewinellaceae bacterium]|nr:HNH endonuclease [Lewinellaceae bacterium]
MMKLTRPLEPEELKRNKDALTQEYAKDKKKAVWRKDYIVEPLYKSANKKCAYCGILIKWNKGNHSYFIEIDEEKQISATIPPGESDFLHVDHFYAKKYAEDKVVEWDNLIPSCPACNYKKALHNVTRFPIINPYNEEPRNYFAFNTTLTVKCTIDNESQKKASRTIEVFQFRDRLFEQLREFQWRINESISEIYKGLERALKDFESGNISKLNEVNGQIKKLLEHGLPKSKYGPFIATMILKHNYFPYIKNQLSLYNIWNDDLTRLEKQLKEISYE